MIPVAVTQRVEVTRYGERRDCLDQRWTDWMIHCGLLPVPVPNDAAAAAALCDLAQAKGLLLTGGNDLASLGGDAPERDATERRLLTRFEASGLPVIGVCRGMQVIQARFGVPLYRIEGHVTAVAQVRLADGATRRVNSYHRFGTLETVPELEVLVRAADGTVKAIRHTSRPIFGMMWHPERLDPFPERDAEQFRRCFGRVAACAA